MQYYFETLIKSKRKQRCLIISYRFNVLYPKNHHLQVIFPLLYHAPVFPTHSPPKATQHKVMEIIKTTVDKVIPQRYGSTIWGKKVYSVYCRETDKKIDTTLVAVR